MSSEINEEDENLPTREHCQKVIEEFVSITGTDEALAQFFLQDRQWNLQQSVTAYFDDKNLGDDVTIGDVSDIVPFQIPGFNGKFTTKPPEEFSLMSWNLDGLDHHNLKKRTKAVAKIIYMEKPDIVFLQETIPATYSYLEDHLPFYMLVAGGTSDYFTAILLYRMTVYFDSHTLHSFPGTVMDRNLLLVNCHIGGLKLRLLNTHLESTAEFSKERMTQLKQCFNFLKAGPPDKVSIFGGDLNIRDKEISEVGLPGRVQDLWESCGRRKECQYTWDTLRNSNKSFPGKFKPRLRFDRLYLLDSLTDSLTTSVSPEHFGLTGIQKISGTQSFPSDHWGIFVHFKILNQAASSTSSPPASYKVQELEAESNSSGPSCSFKPSSDDSVVILDDDDDDIGLDGTSKLNNETIELD